MDRQRLEAELAKGRSIEAIAREAGEDARAVGRAVRAHGLTSAHAERHAPRGGVDRERLEALVEAGLTVQQLAVELGIGGTAVRHWLRRFGLRTRRAGELREHADQGGAPVEIRRCRHHGETDFVRTGVAGHYRCRLCRSAHVARRRRRLKQILVEEAGGRCAVCGYDRFVGALQFHHLDPEAKAFSLSDQGVARSLAKARHEADKCILLCANCHAEVEAGIATIPP